MTEIADASWKRSAARRPRCQPCRPLLWGSGSPSRDQVVAAVTTPAGAEVAAHLADPAGRQVELAALSGATQSFVHAPEKSKKTLATRGVQRHNGRIGSLTTRQRAVSHCGVGARNSKEALAGSLARSRRAKANIAFAGGDVNLYRYVKNNPLKFTDPSGLQAVIEFAVQNKGILIPGFIVLFYAGAVVHITCKARASRTIRMSPARISPVSEGLWKSLSLRRQLRLTLG